MGVINFIKEAIEYRKMIKALDASITEHIEKEELYVSLPKSSLTELADEELIFAVTARADSVIYKYSEFNDGLKDLNDEQRLVYALNSLEMEVNNGGICQFFVNSSRAFAPMISEYMEIVGAEDHRSLYDGFVSKYEIDLDDLSSFDSDTSEEFIEQYERYPFDEYDDAFYQLKPLETYLIPYIKANIDKF